MDRWQPLVRLLIGLVAAIGLAALIINTLITGRDVPTGILTLLLSIIGAVYGVDALKTRGKGDDT